MSLLRAVAGTEAAVVTAAYVTKQAAKLAYIAAMPQGAGGSQLDHTALQAKSWSGEYPDWDKAGPVIQTLLSIMTLCCVSHVYILRRVPDHGRSNCARRAAGWLPVCVVPCLATAPKPRRSILPRGEISLEVITFYWMFVTKSNLVRAYFYGLHWCSSSIRLSCASGNATTKQHQKSCHVLHPIALQMRMELCAL